MESFIVRNICTDNIETELERIGFDSSYKSIASNKFQYKNIKIYDLTPAQANILKQTALSVGADCATHRDVITGNAKKSDAILGGSFSQIKKIAAKLQSQPFLLKKLGEILLYELKKTERKTKIVGILNVTPDSFSDGGKYFNPEDAIEHAIELIKDGADIIDIGAESTKPYSNPVPFEEQITRLKPVLEGLKDISIPISIDTRSSFVAKFGLENGASIINDVSGMSYDPRIADIVAEHNATIILQHSNGTPENMQDSPFYNDVVEEVYFNLINKIECAKHRGVKNIILDIGIGFGKTKEHNYELLNRIEEFFSLNLPLMVGLSRKSLLGVSDDDNNLKDSLSLALSYPLIKKGVDYLRVHNVKLHKQLIDSTI